MLNRWILGLAVLSCLAAAPAARADLMFVLDKTSYTFGVPGSKIPVTVTLRETASPGNFQLLNEGGLISAGVMLSTPGPVIATVASKDDILPNPQFAGADKYLGPAELNGNPGDLAGLFEYVGLFDPAVQPVQVDANTVELVIGTFVLTGQQLGAMTLVASSVFPAANFTAFGGDPPLFLGSDLDSSANGGQGITPAQAEVLGVPEPASAALFALALAAAGLVRRRRGAEARG